MKRGLKALEAEWCNDYHCAGDCGLNGHGWQHQKRKKASELQEEDRLLTLFAETRGYHEGDRAHILRFARAVIDAEKRNNKP